MRQVEAQEGNFGLAHLANQPSLWSTKLRGGKQLRDRENSRFPPIGSACQGDLGRPIGTHCTKLQIGLSLEDRVWLFPEKRSNMRNPVELATASPGHTGGHWREALCTQGLGTARVVTCWYSIGRPISLRRGVERCRSGTQPGHWGDTAASGFDIEAAFSRRARDIEALLTAR